jgi:hypothetical protein
MRWQKQQAIHTIEPGDVPRVPCSLPSTEGNARCCWVCFEQGDEAFTMFFSSASARVLGERLLAAASALEQQQEVRREAA